MSGDRTSFDLPGHDPNELAERKCLLSLFAAYSRPCNIEFPWYERWTQILADLVAGHASLSVAPQSYLWYDRGLPAPEPHTTPGPRYLLSTEDEHLDELFDDVGNTTLESIRSISIPSHRNRCRIPDIAITRKVSIIRPNHPSQLLYLARRVTYLGIPLLAELKVSGARCHDVRTSLSNATLPMSLARDQVPKQANHLFQMYPHQNSVVLIAITGFWWSYMIFHREQVHHLDPVDDDDDDDDDDDEEEPNEESASILPDQNGIHLELAQAASDSDKQSLSSLQEELYGFSLDTSGKDIIAVNDAKFRTVLHDDERDVNLVEGDRSDYMLYGTAPSNQILCLILERLHSVVHIHYDGKMG